MSKLLYNVLQISGGKCPPWLRAWSLRWRYKQLLSTSTSYAGGTNSCFLNQPLRWWYIPTLEVQPYAGATDAADPYS